MKRLYFGNTLIDVFDRYDDMSIKTVERLQRTAASGHGCHEYEKTSGLPVPNRRKLVNVITNKRKLINFLFEHITVKCSQKRASNLPHVQVYIWLAAYSPLHEAAVITAQNVQIIPEMECT